MEQRLEDALSECWETATLEEPVVLLGFAELELQLRCDRPCALVAARLCDVFPTGESSLITRGMSTADLDTFNCQIQKCILSPKPHNQSINSRLFFKTKNIKGSSPYF